MEGRAGSSARPARSLPCSDLMPGCEGVRNAAERRFELGIVAYEYARHRVVVDPVHAGLRVDLRGVVRGEEAIALQPAGGHQDEDAEGRIAKTKACWQILRIHTYHQV